MKNQATKKIQEQAKSFPRTKISGIWGADDWEKMYKLIGLSKKEGYGYCMLIDEKRGIAEVHFVKQIFKDKNVYTLAIREIKEQKPGLWRIAFAHRGKLRQATIWEKRPGSFYLYSDDSTPYRERVDMLGSRDGNRYRASLNGKSSHELYHQNLLKVS